jgi:tRNA dimethylallyltransferase
MFHEGLIEETRAVLGLHDNDARAPFDDAIKMKAGLKPLRSLGYLQALQFLSGELSLDAAVEECKTRTRQYAKRQMTWFRADSRVIWLRGFGDESHIQQQALCLVREFLLSTNGNPVCGSEHQPL